MVLCDVCVLHCVVIELVLPIDIGLIDVVGLSWLCIRFE